MINLLPPEQKKELLEIEKLRLILILGIVVSAFLVSLTLILFLVKISLASDLEIQKIYLEQERKELASSQLQDLKIKIKELNSHLSKLSSFYHQGIDLTKHLEKISQLLPPGTYLTLLNFNPSLFQFSLSGFAPDQASLLKFKENLEKEGFKEIHFSPASWIEPTDIDFSVTFKLK